LIIISWFSIRVDTHFFMTECCLLVAEVRRREKMKEMCVRYIIRLIGLENPTVDLTLYIMDKLKTCAC
jgi:hypothetical protein